MFQSPDATAAGRKKQEADQSEAFFADTAVRTFKIEVAEPALTALSKDNRAYVRATVREGDKLQGGGTMVEVSFDNRAALHVAVTNEDTILSFRTKAFLPEGRYRFEALARTARVVGLTNTVERGNGAGLRTSGEKREHQLTGDHHWTPLVHGFEVMPGGEEREFVCELRAHGGEASFDVNSLRVVRP